MIAAAAAAAKSLQSCPTLCDPMTAAHQASPSLGFSRQEHWSGLPLPSPMHESEKWKWSRSVVSDSSDPMDCSLPGSSVHGIFQAKVLEWVAIAFSTSPITSWQIGKQWKQWQTLFSWALKSLQMVTVDMKLKDTCSLEEKLWPM